MEFYNNFDGDKKKSIVYYIIYIILYYIYIYTYHHHTSTTHAELYRFLVLMQRRRLINLAGW